MMPSMMMNTMPSANTMPMMPMMMNPMMGSMMGSMMNPMMMGQMMNPMMMGQMMTMPGMCCCRCTMEMTKDGMVMKMMPMDGTSPEMMEQCMAQMQSMMSMGMPMMMMMMMGGMPMMMCGTPMMPAMRK